MSEKKESVINYYFITSKDLEELKKFFLSNKIPFTSNNIIQKNDTIQNTNITNIIKNENTKPDFINNNKIENTQKSMKENEEKKTLSTDPDEKVAVEIPDEKESDCVVNKKNMFFVNKKRKTGRKLKSSNYKVEREHTKYYKDNISRKIKVKFFKKVREYINRIILSKYSDKIKTLLPLNGAISKNHNIEFNYKLLNTKLKDIFSTNQISGKCTNYDKFYDKKVVETIYNLNIKELIDILEMTFIEVFNIYRNLNETEKLVGLEKYDSVIKELKLKEEDDYIDEFERVTMNFEETYLKTPRKK